MDKPVKEGQPTKLLPKSIDGRFRIVREIGRGAAGMVYEGVQLSVDRRVAIKVLHADHQANKDYIERFAREAKAIARLNQTNCITLFDFGFSEEFRSHYMVMEYVDGRELFEIVLDGKLPFRIALRLAIQISEGIAHAHKHGILHRDLKPENVIVTHDWEAKVLDFGLARLLDMFAADAGGRRLTAQGAVFGTPAYMSPEQCAGDLDVTVRSDIYSLGVMLYELFEGNLPFDSKDVVKILVMHAKDPPPPMKADVPEEVKSLVIQMLQKDPQARPRTGLQVADQLRTVLITMAADLNSPGADISQEIQRSLLRGIDRTDQTGESFRITEDGLEQLANSAPRMAARSPRTQTLDLVGQRLGPYTVGQLLGEGAMSSVFRATKSDGEEVAIKIVGHAVPEQLRASERFHTEVEALGRLFDPTIVTLLDSGYDEEVDRLYLVTELVDGDDLASICGAGRTPTELAMRVGEDVLRALKAAHEQGVVHRDLKPSNVMLVPQSDGRVRAKVLDFGLARLVGDETRLTSAGLAPGTVRYMSPEQLRGQEANQQSDLYSLGVVLYEMLSGHPPFDARSHKEAVKAVLEGEPAALASFVQEVPTALSDFVARLMSQTTSRRPPSAGAALEQLRLIRHQASIRDVLVQHSGRAADLTAAWRLRRRVAAPAPRPKSQPQPAIAQPRSPGPRAPTGRMAAVNDGPLDWQPSSSRGWIAALIAIFVIAAVIGAFVVFGGGGI